MTPISREELVRRACAIRLAAFDVDGVMTDGRLSFDSLGHEHKTFHVRDGVGLKLLRQAGIELAIITGRESPIVQARASELGILHVLQGIEDKRAACETLLSRLQLDWTQCAYMGDDLPDLPVLRRCILALTVPEAPEAVRREAHWIATVGGGQGAVRCAADMILEARGQWQDVLKPWRD